MLTPMLSALEPSSYVRRASPFPSAGRTVARPHVFVLFALALASGLHAQTTNWIAGTGSWSVAGNWSNGLPNSTTDATINNGGTATLAGTGTANVLMVGASAAHSGSLAITTGGALSAANSYVGLWGGTGTATVSGGTWSTNYISVPYVSTGTGSLTISGGAVSVGAESYVGYNGTGAATVSGGSWSAGNLYLGIDAGAPSAGIGTLTITGGMVTTNVLTLALDLGSTGTLNLNGGVLATGSIYEATGTGGGHINLNGGTLRALVGTQNFFNFFETGDVQLLAGGAVFDTQGFSVTISADTPIALQGAGGLTKIGVGTLTLTAANTYTGGTTISLGKFLLSGSGRLADTGPVMVDGGTFGIGIVSDTVGAITLKSGSITGTTGVLVGTSYDVESGTISARLGGSSGLNKTTSGTVTLSGTNTYTGTTTVNAGSLVVNGATVGSAFTVNAGGTLRGSGSVGALTIANGGRVAPGSFSAGADSPGKLTALNTVFNGGGSLRWEINNATGTAPTNWDFLSISGSLTLASTPADPFTIRLKSLTSSNLAGPAANFNSAANATFIFATATGGISGFNASAFTVDTTGFQNALAGTWSVAQIGNSLALVYTILPTPASITLHNLAAIYDGTPKPVSATTVPAGLAVTFTYAGSATAPTNAGSYAVAASINDPVYSGTISGTLVIAPAAQTITFSAIPDMTFGQPPFALSAGATSGLPVAFSIVSGPATVTGNTVTLTGAGTVAVRASQPGNADYNAAPYLDRMFTVSRAPLVAIAQDATRAYGQPNPAFTFSYSGFVNGDTAAMLDAAPVAVTTANAESHPGTYPITASGGADANYAFGYVNGELTITPAAQTIDFPAVPDHTFGDVPFALGVTASSGLPVNVVVLSGPATVANNVVALTGAGEVALRAIQPGNADYTAAPYVDRRFAVAKAAASIALGNFSEVYDGSPKPVTAVTDPAGLAVTLTYDGNSSPPTLPGTYAVSATVNDDNFSGNATCTLEITITALVRRAPHLNGAIDGSLQVLTGEDLVLDGNAWVSGDILVPGTPQVRLNGHPVFAATRDGTGSATPSNYRVTLNGNALVRYLDRRTDPIALPTVSAPPAPTGTRNVTLNSPTDDPGSFATLRNLTLNGDAGAVAVPTGTYGAFIANGKTGFVFGDAGATTRSVYNLGSLTINGSAQIQIVGPVLVRLASGASFNGNVGAAGHPEWLTLEVAIGDVTLEGDATFNGTVVAPSGKITIGGNSQLIGTVASDRLVISGNAMLTQPDATP